MPKSPDEISSRGLGCMRVSTSLEGKIDEVKAFERFHHAFQDGVNYIDTV
ncbi:MAG: hypothetical protein Q8M98_03450 [Candidatus Cloacimonadaceae bacterium]|nr:hypothetical protein [Candidatus Cloacimonadaceae bacterium]MDP3113812.1 hypothetical protein [Candidatus Cloacimonadaceae bacterium]